MGGAHFILYKTRSGSNCGTRDSNKAGIRTVRFQARHKPKVEAIRAMILGPTVTEAGKATTEHIGLGAVPVGATPFTQQ